MAESRKHEKYDALIYSCCALAPVRTAVAHPCDEPSLASALGAARAKIIKPILVGPEAKIRALAASRSLDLAGLQLVDTSNSHSTAEKARCGAGMSCHRPRIVAHRNVLNRFDRYDATHGLRA
jgi:phosphate acetyltransferase